MCVWTTYPTFYIILPNQVGNFKKQNAFRYRDMQKNVEEIQKQLDELVNDGYVNFYEDEMAMMYNAQTSRV